MNKGYEKCVGPEVKIIQKGEVIGGIEEQYLCVKVPGFVL